MVFLEAHGHGYLIAGAFFGVHMVLLGPMKSPATPWSRATSAGRWSSRWPSRFPNLLDEPAKMRILNFV